jgi:hypothetical protein
VVVLWNAAPKLVLKVGCCAWGGLRGCWKVLGVGWKDENSPNPGDTGEGKFMTQEERGKGKRERGVRSGVTWASSSGLLLLWLG